MQSSIFVLLQTQTSSTLAFNNSFFALSLLAIMYFVGFCGYFLIFSSTKSIILLAPPLEICPCNPFEICSKFIFFIISSISFASTSCGGLDYNLTRSYKKGWNAGILAKFECWQVGFNYTEDVKPRNTKTSMRANREYEFYLFFHFYPI